MCYTRHQFALVVCKIAMFDIPTYIFFTFFYYHHAIIDSRVGRRNVDASEFIRDASVFITILARPNNEKIKQTLATTVSALCWCRPRFS